MYLLCFFFFKQKTAYEMRISDWSSDVCSSDLLLLVENANRLTRFHRDLAHIRIPNFNLVRFMEIEKARYNEDWQRILIQLATSVVSEIFVSDYLHQLSECHDIQPMNRATVAAHRHDELAHRSEEHTSEL